MPSEAAKTSAILQIVSVLIERAFTIALAVLLLRLHQKMAVTGSLMFMQGWVGEEQKVTIVVITFLVVALAITIAAQVLVLVSVAEEEAGTPVESTPAPADVPVAPSS